MILIFLGGSLDNGVAMLIGASMGMEARD